MPDSLHASSPLRLGIGQWVDAIDLPIGRWDRLNRLIFCNTPYLAWAQRTSGELLGRSLAELYGDDAWAAAESAFREAFEGRRVHYERLLGHGSRNARWVRVEVLPDIDELGQVEGVFTVAVDIHADVLARAALEAERDQLHRFTENIPCPLTYVDREFVLRFVNKAYCETVNQGPEALLGRHIGEARGARRWNEHVGYFERALKGQSVQYTRLVDRMPTGPRWIRTSYVPDFDPRRQVRGVYTVTIDVHELSVAQEKLKRSLDRDALTDVLSRRAMNDRIESAMLDAEAAPVALFFIDLDGFKAVNDRHGHTAGDRMLIDVGAALQAAVRAEDAVGRFGGDEFLVLAQVRDAAGAHTLALHLLAAVRAVAPPSIDAPGLDASIGYALAPTDALHAMTLLQLADDAMYAAKKGGTQHVLHGGTTPPSPVPG